MTPRTGWPARRLQVVAIDMCAIFASAVRKMLPRAAIAVKTVGDVRRRAIRELYGRRGKAGDPEYGIKSLLIRNLENLSPEQFEKIIDILDATAPGQQMAIAWIAKEKLRDKASTASPNSRPATPTASATPPTSDAASASPAHVAPDAHRPEPPLS